MRSIKQSKDSTRKWWEIGAQVSIFDGFLGLPGSSTDGELHVGVGVSVGPLQGGVIGNEQTITEEISCAN